MTRIKIFGLKIVKALTLSAFLIHCVLNAAFANDGMSIERFLQGNKTANFMDVKFLSPKQQEQVIVIMSSLDAATIDMMMVFKDDRCVGELRHNQGTGSFKLNCLNGGELKSSFSCSSKEQCFMRGKHSQRGKFIFNLKYSPKQMTLAEIADFGDQTPAAANQLANASQSNAAAENIPAVTVANSSPSPQMTADSPAQTAAMASNAVASLNAIPELKRSIADTLQRSGGYSKAFIFGREKMEGYLFVDFTETEEWKHKVVLVAGDFECLSQPDRDLSVAKFRCLNGDEYLGVVQDVGDGARVTGAFTNYGDAKIVIPQFRMGNLKDALRIVGRAEYEQILALSDPSRTEPKADQNVQTASVVPATGNAAPASSVNSPTQQTTPEPAQPSSPTTTTLPVISITSTSSAGPQGVLEGNVSNAANIAELRVDGRVTPVDSDGSFSARTFVPIGGADVMLEAFDLAGLSTTKTVRLERSDNRRTALSFDQLNPLKRKAAKNSDAIALIIGVANYAGAAAPAIYADTDAQVFHDYAAEKLGVPTDRIEMLINDAADEKGMLLAVKRWLTRAAKPGKSDVYVFFAGHGLATDDGEDMYLLPYDGTPELLEKTAILRDELFQDIASVKPRSVTVFLDTCYSGATRGAEMLIASRPIAIKAKEKPVPDGFTLITAAAGDETAKPLEEAKHGMFSYFLMKGLEGDADRDGDNQITTGELHAYVQQNVMQQSSGSQTPTLTGESDRVLVRFQ
jgi:hypothetical protein